MSKKLYEKMNLYLANQEVAGSVVVISISAGASSGKQLCRKCISVKPLGSGPSPSSNAYLI